MKYNRDWNNVNSIEILIHGLVMGTINKLPGISGGLYSLIIGFYNHLINSIQSLNYKNFQVLKEQGLKLFLKKINAFFLLFISAGMILSYFTTSKILDYFIVKNELLVWSVFFGLIIGVLGTFHGLNTTVGARGVGISTISAVVWSSISVLAANYILTEALFNK